MISSGEVIGKEIKEATSCYNNFLYDFSITTLKEKSRSRRYTSSFYVPSLVNKSNSVIVIRIFSYVAADYFFQKEIIPTILYHLNKKYKSSKIWFGYDDYILDRKQYALRSGAGFLTKPSLIFDKRFGLNCKFDLIFTNLKFDQYTVIEEENPVYKDCIGCEAPCESNCPQNCRMNFKLIDWKKCENFTDRHYLFQNPDKMCRICQDKCPFSEEVKNKILMNNPSCGGYMKNEDYYRTYMQREFK